MTNLDNFYRAFEDQHRGPSELIRARHAQYLPLVRAARQLHPDAPVLDLGCGRGEWLSMLSSENVPALGIDEDEGMLRACREAGLNAVRGDAIETLAGMPDASRSVITAFHVVEHLPFAKLHELVNEARRVLRPGGVLVMETPNPENLVTGSCNFYIDPTHERPLPPALLAFVPRFHGFERVTVLRLHEHASVRGTSTLSLVDVLAGVSPDYAVIAATPARGMHSADMDAIFSQSTGVSLQDLAVRYQAQSTASLAEVRRLAQAAHDAATRLEAQVAENAYLHWQLSREREQVAALLSSGTWRATYPLRWVSWQLQALRKQGPLERARRLLRKLRGIAPTPEVEPEGAPAATAAPLLEAPPDLTASARRAFVELQQPRSRTP